MTAAPAAVTFDFWDTLVRAPTAAATRLARRDRLLVALRDAGVDVQVDDLDARLAAIRRTFDERWAANEQYTGAEATARLLGELGATLDAGHERAVAEAFMGIGDGVTPPLTDNIEPTLRALKAAGVRLGIICDVGLSPSTVLRSHLEHHGVLDLFDHWSFSDEVGVYKPDARIFEHALQGLGAVAPDAAAHVGDLRRTDVAGALAFGMTAVRYAGSNDDAHPDSVTRAHPKGEGDASMAMSASEAPEAPHVIHDHADLLGVLGLA